RRLTNIAPGISSNDAATVGQVNQSAKRAYGGIATAMAMGGIAVPESKFYALSANLGAYRGETALAGGVAFRLTDNATLNGSLGVGVNHGDVGGRVGVTFLVKEAAGMLLIATNRRNDGAGRPQYRKPDAR